MLVITRNRFYLPVVDHSSSFRTPVRSLPLTLTNTKNIYNYKIQQQAVSNICSDIQIRLKLHATDQQNASTTNKTAFLFPTANVSFLFTLITNTETSRNSTPACKIPVLFCKVKHLNTHILRKHLLVYPETVLCDTVTPSWHIDPWKHVHD